MDGVNIDNQLLDFIRSFPLDCTSIYRFNDAIKSNIGPLMESLNICKFMCSIHIEPDFDISLAKDDVFNFYSKGKTQEQPYSVYYSEKTHGSANYLFYPFDGECFSNEVKAILDFLARNIYIFAGRTRMRGILNQLPNIDIQTGLYNVTGIRKYSDEFDALGKNAADYSCGNLNIKGFAYTNQIIGQRAGDYFLRAFADEVKRIMPNDCLMSRLGGDNFYFVVRNEDLEAFIAEMATLTIEINLEEKVKKVPVKFRVGIYKMSKEDSISDSIPKARAALASARQSIEQDIVVFKSAFMDELNKKKFVVENFHDALKNKEFVVYYQPKVDNRDRSIYGCEALVRWINDGRIINPGEFIPILEENGNICSLDFYVLEYVCRDLVAWIEKGIEPVRTSVNFSRLNLHNKRIASDIVSIIDRCGLDHKYIEIELTESSGYEDFSAFSQFISEMKANNIATSIDDFGTGYSSLNLLKDLNADIVKIDKSFIDKIENMDKADDVIISSVINMAHELDMAVVTEGVETKQQAQYLKERNCYHIQGFLFDKPLEHDDFENRLLNKVYAE